MSKKITFQWGYFVVPAAVLLLLVIAVAYFYRLLPDQIAYGFRDGAPSRWMSRGGIIALTLGPQVLFFLLAAAVAWGVSFLSGRFPQVDSGRIRPVISVMGNMMALPQIILGFAMLDIFSYNAFKTHLMPLWIFALIVMVLAAIALGTFFVLALRRAQPNSQKNLGVK